MNKPMSGIIAPILTSLNNDLSFNAELYLRHAHGLLEQGMHALVPFGTTGEALSMSVEERILALDTLIDGGVDPATLMPGAGLCNLPETLKLVRHAVDRGCAAVMVLPPFFYKDASDDGIYQHFVQLIEQVNNPNLKICLYHIPAMAGMGFSPTLTARLAQQFSNTVVAYKDSSGDFENTRAIVAAAPDIAVFPGAETFLKAGLENHCAGCISATCNINPQGIIRVFDVATGACEGAVNQLNDEMLMIRKMVESYAPIPAMKAVLADKYGDERWRNVRPPLLQISPTQSNELIAALQGVVA